MIKRVKVIGDGGAFDTSKTNSSFLIEADSGSVLYDCGYNVFPRLKELEETRGNEDIIKNIKYIIISHDDDDHMGSVKSLLFYRYFVHGQSTKLYCPEHMLPMFYAMNREYKGSQYVDADIVSAERIVYISKIHDLEFAVSSIRGVHHTEAYGMIFSDSAGHLVAISGDTKANATFETRVRQRATELKIDLGSALIFHDFSYWDAPSRQVHACKSDIEIEYSEQFRKKCIDYHNSEARIAGNLYEPTDTGGWENTRRKKDAKL